MRSSARLINGFHGKNIDSQQFPGFRENRENQILNCDKRLKKCDILTPTEGCLVFDSLALSFGVFCVCGLWRRVPCARAADRADCRALLAPIPRACRTFTGI